MDSVACRLIEVNNLNDKKKKRYPTDRLKLHALLEKKEQDLIELQEEVEELRRLVKQADHTAIHATADMYNVTPEQLAEIMKSIFPYFVNIWNSASSSFAYIDKAKHFH